VNSVFSDIQHGNLKNIELKEKVNDCKAIVNLVQTRKIKKKEQRNLPF